MRIARTDSETPYIFLESFAGVWGSPSTQNRIFILLNLDTDVWSFLDFYVDFENYLGIIYIASICNAYNYIIIYRRYS